MVKRHGDRVTEIWAYLTLDPADDCEGIPAFMNCSPEGSPMVIPMVCADKARAESMRQIAEAMAKKIGRPIKLVRFTVREEVEIIE